MLAQLVEARACPPRRMAIAALNALRHHAWPGNLAELEGVVKDLAFTALEEEIQLDDVERVMAARGGPGALPEVAFDRPYREAREAFERVYFEHLLAPRARQHVARRRALRAGAHASLPEAQGARPARRPARRMKIVILGAGQVGSSVAESLVSEQNDITVVDIDAEAPARAAGPA